MIFMKNYNLILLITLACVLNAGEFREPDVEKYFKDCDKTGQVLNNKIFKSCYNYNYKSSTVSYIELNSSNIDYKNIKHRPTFYSDLNVLEEFRTNYNDYTGKGFDRGHIQSDASNDYSEEVLRLTYAMSNITLQYPQTNRRSYLSVEKHERELTIKYKNIKALTLISYSDETINGIRVPSDYTKIFWNSEFMKCYIIKNNNIVYSLEEMKIDCLSF